MTSPVVALDENRMPELGQFLLNSFGATARFTEYADPAVLRWKFFDPRGPWPGPRSHAICDEGRILAHLGFCTTAFQSTRLGARSVPALHTTDWLNASADGSLGAILLLEAFARAPVQYAFGCTAVARRSLLRAGFKELGQMPLFHRVQARTKLDCWRHLHGPHRSAKAVALLVVDLLQSVVRSRLRTTEGGFAAREVAAFGSEVQDVIQRCRVPLIFTSREPTLLNHYLRFPKPSASGWLLERDGQVCGFAVLWTLNKPGLRVGRIVECFLDSDDSAAWRSAITCLASKLAALRCDVISCYGSTPWLAAALRDNGFFRRGRTSLYLRDPRRQVQLGDPIHVTHLEADLAYL
jgi:hypothetical protein